MAETRRLTLEALERLTHGVLAASGFDAAHAEAIGRVINAAQRDACHSHGVYRLLGMASAVREGLARGDVAPEVIDHARAIVKVDARFGFSPLAFERGLPALIEKTRRLGIAAMAINRCFHFTALWPEVERIAAEGLVGIAMTPSHAWVAPHGGSRGLFGTNPLAFSWPRPHAEPYVFDFATSAIARGDIELHRRAGKPLEPGWAVDSAGRPTLDPQAALDGAMLNFGGHKGSALATMIELLAGPLIDDMTSLESQRFDHGRGAAPCHGELILTLDPQAFLGVSLEAAQARAEALFAEIVAQGARLPSERRRAARRQAITEGAVEVPAALVEELEALRSGQG